MKKVLFLFKMTLLFTLLLFLIYPAAAQSLNLKKDTVSVSNAKGSHERYKQEMKNANKKATTYVTFSVQTLNEIIDRCSSAGLDSIQFLICTMRSSDTAQYLGTHPGLSASAKRDLIGRQFLIIKVKRSAFTSQSSSHLGKPLFPSAIISLLSSGYVLLDKPYGILPDADYIYFATGTICPPPASCDEAN